MVIDSEKILELDFLNEIFSKDSGQLLQFTRFIMSHLSLKTNFKKI